MTQNIPNKNENILVRGVFIPNNNENIPVKIYQIKMKIYRFQKYTGSGKIYWFILEAFSSQNNKIQQNLKN